MEKALFTGIRNQIISHLREANDEIVIAMAWFTSSELFDAIISCLKRNVRVELILLDDAINYMYYAPDFNYFIQEGGILRIANPSSGFMHHKFCVIDKKISITGSYNWTYYAETRNIENIVITNSAEIVGLYLDEFKRLKNIFPTRSSYHRLSWDEIESRDDIDFNELNYEIEQICEIQNKPIRTVFKTSTEVVQTEIKKMPLAKHAVGLNALDKNDNNIFDIFIKPGEELPHTTPSRTIYIDTKNNNSYSCPLIFGNPDIKNEWHLIRIVDLMDVAKETSEENLPLVCSMHLDDNGSLRFDISCKKTGRKLTVSKLDSNFVKYE